MISGVSVWAGVGGGVTGAAAGSEALLLISVWARGRKIKPTIRSTTTTRIGRATQSDSCPLRFFIGSSLNMAEMRAGVKPG